MTNMKNTSISSSAGYQAVFQRYEQKYLLTPVQYGYLRQELEGLAEPDEYGECTVMSLYYDTPQYDLIRASLEKPTYKEKLRLRSYGTPTLDSRVFLELKKKVKGVVYKRRDTLPLADAERFLQSSGTEREESQILSEIGWFLGRYHPIPRAIIACERTALAGTIDEGLRLTFDRTIRWRGSDLALTAGSSGTPLLEQEAMLLEIKCPAALPLWLSRLLAEAETFPTSFSKYGTCYQRHLLPKLLEKGGILCA